MLRRRRGRRRRRRISKRRGSTVLGGLRALGLEYAKRFNGWTVAVFRGRLVEKHLLIWNTTTALHLEL
jgi:hypothetical protein